MEMSIHKGANFYLFSLIYSILCIFTTTGKLHLFKPTLSEEIAHSTVYHHLIQLTVNIQLHGLIKWREDSGVQIQLTQMIFRSLSCMTVDPSDIQLN